MDKATKRNMTRRVAWLEAEMAAVEATNEYKWGWYTAWAKWFDLARQRDYLLARL